MYLYCAVIFKSFSIWLVNTKQTVAENLGIKFQCDLRVPTITKISDFDLCVLLGNALDNTLEACQRVLCSEEQFITIESCVVRGYLIIEIKNSVRVNELTKHSGAMNLSSSDCVFGLSLMLPID